MIVLDASVMIALLDGSDAHHGRARALLSSAAAEPLAASVVSIAETLVGPRRRGAADAASSALDRLDIQRVAVGADDAQRLAELRAGLGLRLPDCCVLVAAERVDGRIETFDDRLRTCAQEIGRA